MISPNLIRLDNRDFGNQFILTAIRPSYRYIEGNKTQDITGINYEVALPKLSFEKIRVKVEGDQEISEEVLESSNFIEVAFEDLEAHFYFVNGNVGVSATAKSVKMLNVPKKKAQ